MMGDDGIDRPAYKRIPLNSHETLDQSGMKPKFRLKGEKPPGYSKTMTRGCKFQLTAVFAFARV